MKKKNEILSKELNKNQQRQINGGLRDGCWCLFPSQAGPCWHIYWNQPCGQPGQYVICNENIPIDGCGPQEP